MHGSPGRRRLAAALIAAGAIVSVGVARVISASDHQDTPETELNPRMDINDLYAFPAGAAGDSIVLALSTSSPLTPAQTAGAKFDPDLLYQFKIDNSNPLDGVEDLVVQISFDTTANGTREIHVRGPVAPPTVAGPDGTPIPRTGAATTLLRTTPVVTGLLPGGSTPVAGLTGANGAVRVFAGPRDDPFWIDLEQFFKIIPDRKPVSGPLSQIADVGPCVIACAFRGPNPPFTGQTPVDFLAGINTLAIVVQMPKSMLNPPAAANGKIGVWATISR